MMVLVVEGTVDSKILEHGCRMISTGSLSFFLSLVWGWRAVIFQLSDFWLLLHPKALRTHVLRILARKTISKGQIM